MISYFIIILTVPVFMHFVQSNKGTKLSKFLIVLVFLAMVFFAGFRYSFVGTDTNNYVGSFLSYRVATTNYFESTSSVEQGYLFLEKTARNLSDQYWVLLTFIASIVVFFSLRTVLKLSYNYAISIFVFIALGIYLFFFNGARQGLAAAIYGIAVIHLIKGNLKKYILWVLIAFLFHKTVLITLPAYYLFRQKYSLKKTIVTLSLALFFITFWVSIVSLVPGFDSRYYAYDGRGAIGGQALTFFFVFCAILFIYLRRFIAQSDLNRYDLFLNMSIFGSLIYLIVLISGQDISFMRLAHYFMWGYIFIWPLLFKNIPALRSLFPKFVFFAVHLVFFYVFISKMSDLVPYKFNPNLPF